MQEGTQTLLLTAAVAFPCPDKIKGLLSWVAVRYNLCWMAVLDPLADGICYHFQHLGVTLVVATRDTLPWYNGCLGFALVKQGGSAGHITIDRLDQERNVE